MKGEQTVAGLMPSSSNARQISNLTAQICETHSTAYSSKGNHCRFPPACYEQRCQLCLNDYSKIIVFAQWKKQNKQETVTQRHGSAHKVKRRWLQCSNQDVCRRFTLPESHLMANYYWINIPTMWLRESSALNIQAGTPELTGLRNNFTRWLYIVWICTMWIYQPWLIYSTTHKNK